MVWGGMEGPRAPARKRERSRTHKDEFTGAQDIKTRGASMLVEV